MAAEILADSPSVIGLSWYCWNHRLMQDLARVLRAVAPNCLLVVGGPEAGTIMDAELAAFPDGTLFVLGEGELTFVEIVGAVIESGGIPDPLWPGTARVDGASGIMRAAGRGASAPPDQLPSPVLTQTLHDASSNWLPSYATTRGCVFKCSFCAWQDGFREREFDLDRVRHELDVLAERDYDRIWITDTIFGRDDSRGVEILRKLQQWPSATRFAVELHAKYLSERLADELAKVPLAWAAVGIQSLAPDVLRLTRRSTHTDQLLESVSRLYSRLPDRSAIHLDIIFGLPRQTVEDCFSTVDLLLAAFPDATIFTGMLQVLAGTAFESLLTEPGWVVLPPEGDFEVVGTPELGQLEMTRLRDLNVGLDAHLLRRLALPEGDRATSAVQLEALGRALRDTPFAHHPVYGRRERFEAAQIDTWLAGLVHG
jgi:anaerobic magnesium-protoporphyrin IX monomethyl ester cyclase